MGKMELSGIVDTEGVTLRPGSFREGVPTAEVRTCYESSMTRRTGSSGPAVVQWS